MIHIYACICVRVHWMIYLLKDLTGSQWAGCLLPGVPVEHWLSLSTQPAPLPYIDLQVYLCTFPTFHQQMHSRDWLVGKPGTCSLFQRGRMYMQISLMSISLITSESRPKNRCPRVTHSTILRAATTVTETVREGIEAFVYFLDILMRNTL